MKQIILLWCMAIGLSTAYAQSASDKRIITFDLRAEKGPFNQMFKACIGAGRANEGLRADWQEQLKEVKQDCDFQYIRMHGLLSDDMAVYKEDRQGNPIYNYQYIDVLYDYLLETGIKPFVELSFMPSALASGPETIFWWKGNVTPPKDYQKWEDLVRHLVQHWTTRYGVEEVKSWYFEVWNEPNLTPGFWTGTQQEYFTLYQHAAKAVKSVNGAYKVGGPATAGAAWEPEMIAYCHKNNVPLDFISTHAYGVDAGFLDEFGQQGTRLSNNEWSVSQDVLQSRKEILASKMPDLELHYTEWSASYTPADPIHDSYHEAAYILHKIKQSGEAANSMSYWVFTDIFEEAGPRFTPFHGGFGLMNTQGIKKPAYQAYAFLNKLGHTELKNDDDASWACKSDDGGFQVLLWDYSYTLPDSVNNQAYYIQDLPAKSKGNVQIAISGIPEGKYQLVLYQVGYKHNDPFTLYHQMNQPAQLTKEQEAYLKANSSGAPEDIAIVTIDASGQMNRELHLHENEVYLLSFKKL